LAVVRLCQDRPVRSRVCSRHIRSRAYFRYRPRNRTYRKPRRSGISTRSCTNRLPPRSRNCSCHPRCVYWQKESCTSKSLHLFVQPVVSSEQWNRKLIRNITVIEIYYCAKAR
jgi:hypothetical protein